jgi:transketolase
MEPLADKWTSFGFQVSECNGHDVGALRDRLRVPDGVAGPRLIICHTVKGKGIPDAEHNPTWHHKARLSADEFSKLRAALGG